MVRRLYFLLLCTLLSCAYVRVGIRRDTYNDVLLTFPVYWQFDNDFPDNNKLPVRQAFSYWNSLFTEDVFFEEVKDSNCNNNILVSFRESDNKSNAEAHGTADGYNVYCDGERFTKGNIVFYNKWFADTEVMQTNIARHEIGHYVFGVEHSVLQNDLMYRYINYNNSGLYNGERKNISIYEHFELQNKYGKLVKDE